MALRERTVLITGAAQSLGRAIALAFFKEDYNVILADIDYAKVGEVGNEINGLGGESLTVKCDVTKKEEIEDLILKSLARYKRIDVLVNNAEIRNLKPFADITITDWENMLNVNLRGTLIMSQATSKEMNEGSKIIHISSIASMVAFNGTAHYAASKGGLESMMRVMAFELAEKKITVNAVVSGILDTAEFDNTLKMEAQNNMVNTSPESRMGTPEDIAGAVIFLASNKANYITGQTLVVDGGYTLR